MRRLRLQLIAGFILLFIPFFLDKAEQANFPALAFIWFGTAGLLMIHYYLNPLDKLWKMMRTLEPEISTFTYKNFLKKVTDRMKAQEELISREIKGREEVESILYSMVEGVIATDSSGRISFMNPIAEQIFQIEAGTALNKYPREVWREFELVELFHQVFVTGKPQTREFELDC